MSPTFTVIAFALGLVGTILGITNGVRQILASRVRIRVKCYGLGVIQPDKTIQSCFCVEIANLSTFPITATEIKFIPTNDSKSSMGFIENRCLDGKALPRRVDPRDSIIVSYKEGASTMVWQSDHVVVKTACGAQRKGSLRQWKKFHPKGEDEAS